MKVKLMEPWDGKARGTVVDLPRFEAVMLISARTAVDMGNADMREPARVRDETNTQETDR